MKFHVVTLFPEMILKAAEIGVVGSARKAGLIDIEVVNPREFTKDVHHSVDDRPFGGSDGMLMTPEPVANAIEKMQNLISSGSMRTIHLSPRGQLLTDAKLRELAKFDRLILVASRYAGLDQRVINTCIDEEISIGDYVLSGGEIAALTLIDGVSRLLPGVLGNQVSEVNESFAPGSELLEQPQFTRPREWRGQAVPQALLSGHHIEIAKWNLALRILVTAARRPELLGRVKKEDLLSARKFFEKLTEMERQTCGLETSGLMEERLAKALERGS